MTNEKMEQRLVAALEKTAPDDVSGVLSRCEARKGTVINMETKKTTKRRWTSLIAACLAVMLLGGGLFYQQANAVASVVSLDVNPSIELKVNRSEKVLVCTPLNEDAKAILADMSNGADLKGAKLDVAVNAIVGSLVRNGYLDSISSAIMISVEDKDTARAEKLQRELTSAVDGVHNATNMQANLYLLNTRFKILFKICAGLFTVGFIPLGAGITYRLLLNFHQSLRPFLSGTHTLLCIYH